MSNKVGTLLISLVVCPYLCLVDAVNDGVVPEVGVQGGHVQALINQQTLQELQNKKQNQKINVVGFPITLDNKKENILSEGF